MTRMEVAIVPGVSLRSQPAAAFVRAACEYAAQIRILDGDKELNAKSMMGVLSLGTPACSVLTLQAEGDDEEQALQRLSPMLKTLFSN